MASTHAATDPLVRREEPPSTRAAALTVTTPQELEFHKNLKESMKRLINMSLVSAAEKVRGLPSRNIKGPPDLAPDERCLAIVHNNQYNSRLLRLPAEIRNRILQLAMDVVDPAPSLHDELPVWDRLNVSHTSRQIFAETAPRYFATRLVYFASALNECLGTDELDMIANELLTPSQKRAVRQFSLRWDDIGFNMRYGIVDLKALRDFPHLERITVARMKRHATDRLRDSLCEVLRGEAGKVDLVIDFKYM